MFQTDTADKYRLDDLGRIRPIHQMGWTRERWQDAPSFDEAMEGVAAFAMTEAFPNEDPQLGPEQLSDLQAKRYLDIADGFYLATAIDARFGVWRFVWQGEVFFTMRPDFVIRSLVSDLGERPINILESSVRDRLIDYYREIEALKYALAKGEIEAMEVYPMEWWMEFWKVRGISTPTQIQDSSVDSSAKEKLLSTSERNTLLTIIAALCDYSAIKLTERGVASQIAKLTEEIGTSISDDTVRRVLAKIPEALELRKK